MTSVTLRHVNPSRIARPADFRGRREISGLAASGGVAAALLMAACVAMMVLAALLDKSVIRLPGPNRFYEELLDSIARVVYRLDFGTGRFEYISGAATRLFGMDLESVRESGVELIGRHFLPGDYEAAMAALA